MAEAWSIAGEFTEACSCRFLCPCLPSNASAPATEEFCKFAMTYRIDRGRFGALRLDGVAFTLIAQSKAVMAQGGWVLGVVVDAAASPEQANVIEQITGGRAGGPMAAFAPLIADFRGVERHPIVFEMNGHRRTVSIPGVLELEVEGVPSASTPGACLAIDEVFHPANKRLALARAARTVMSAFGISWRDDSGERNGHFAPFAWSGAA